MSQEKSPQHYSEEEAALILRRAARLQDAATPRTVSGFTLVELQEIAAEAGIDPRHVAEAVARLPTVPDPWARVLRAPTRFRHSHTLAAAVPDPLWSDMVAQVRETLQITGQASHLPGVLEWHSNDERTPPIQVRVTSVGHGTQVDIDADLRGSAFASLTLSGTAGVVLAMLVGGAGLGLGGGPEILGLMAAGGGGGLALGWSLWRRTARRWQRRLDLLLSRLAGRVNEARGEPDDRDPAITA